ncbi:outer membrane beta-barrel protein [Mucilaginibacter galii]|uniref:outer membrane beta-barrel protein n=1 Tax=Mucilaginibacter galii TaxID=2005073 RepID=UPI00166465CC|nr:outer membrane beta-barrel protein [Mucilaginibacter galii]
MKKLILLIVLITVTCGVYAQVPARSGAAAKPPLPFREVSGIIKDSIDNTIIGATVKLKTGTDSMLTTTNADGIFVFKNVKSATFVLSITSIGFRPVVRKMLNNDAVPRLVLDPIILNGQSNQLAAVVVNGTPSITYKTDTVEYKASDYKVRPNASVDELLKKMEGMEVGTDGSLTHQGQAVTRAKLNGKIYSGGNLAQAIQNLPADIVEKIQVVDDYGDQAARTGIKDGDPEKVLNITTRADRSVGNIARLSAGAGNNDRYEARAFLQRINGNQQIGVIGDFRNTVNGVASTGTNGGSAGGGNNNNSNSGSGGTTTTIAPTISFADQLSKKVQVNGSYGYSINKVHAITNSNGEQFFNTIPANRGDSTIFFTNNGDSQNNRINHKLDFKLDYQIDSANYLQITPTINFTSSDNTNTSSRFETGLRHQDRLGANNSYNKTPNWGGLILYQHIFKKPRRNLSFQFNYTNSNQEVDNEQNNTIRYYLPTGNVDSLVHRYIERDNLTKNIRTSFTYVEPLSLSSQLELNAQVNYRGYDNTAYTSNISANGQRFLIDSLSNVYDYSFTETRIALNYRLTKTKYNFSLGLTAVPTNLRGTRVSQGNIMTDQNYFNLIPIARFQYAWSRQQRFTLSYQGNPSEPSFNQIQPVRDVSNPQNPVVGNPDLKPAFRHAINTQYNNYISNSRLNLSANVVAALVNNQIVTNNVRIPDAYGAFKNETRYVNLNGSYNVNGNYNISKQLADRKYNLSLIGSVGYNRTVSMLNNVQNFRNTWRLNERFGPRINPNESIEVNPYVAYDVTRNFFEANPASNTDIRTTALAIDGRFFFMKNRTLQVGYSASKNFITGISNNISRNPFVVNAYIENEFFSKRNLIVRLQVFDVLKQNNFVNQVTTENGFTNTLSNALSRYFMLSVRANLQKWTGSPSRNGRQLRRRGDGSFIEP